MTAIAIDDEPIALDIVKTHAAKVPFIELTAVFTNAFEALPYLQQHKTDLIFLDIKMPDISGIDFLHTLSNPPMVIFTTAYTEHAVKSFELDAIDYLLKPFSLSRFLKACNKANELFVLRNKPEQAGEAPFIFVKDGYEQIRVQLDEILFIESAGNYTQIRLANDASVSTRVSISDMEAMLPHRKFIRIHRTCIVARDKISRFDRLQVTINQHVLPVGAKYADSLKELGAAGI
jgi:DNA-binding LytR/AlgR family response regulator